jgi:hypothetical protein
MNKCIKYKKLAIGPSSPHQPIQHSPNPKSRIPVLTLHSHMV